MNDNIDTKEIERKAYFNYHKDGILDIYLGISMAMFTVSFISPTYSMVWMTALLPVFYRDSKRRRTSASSQVSAGATTRATGRSTSACSPAVSARSRPSTTPT